MRKIFLIDDDDIFVLLTKKTILKVSPETEVEVFSDGYEAITHLREIINREEQLPAIIFLDLNMPIMDGWEFLDEYQAIYSFMAAHTRLYIVSSSISPHELERAKNIPVVTDFIIKPLVKEKFLDIIADVTNE